MTCFEVTARHWYNHDPLCVKYRRFSWLGRTCDYKEDLHGELPLKVVVTLAEILQLKYKTATTGKKELKGRNKTILSIFNYNTKYASTDLQNTFL
jgi:hypothetical protein